MLTPETAQASYTWKSSKPKVAEVVDGVVKPLMEGTTVVTVKTHNGKSAKVTVKVFDPLKPTGVKLDVSGTVTIQIGESFTLTPSLLPATAQATYTWKSSKASVATVDENGFVRGIGKGTAKITVTTHNKKSAKITVKVLAPTLPNDPPMFMSAARYKYFKKYMNTEEFMAALKEAESIVAPLVSLPQDQQVKGLWEGIQYYGWDYTMKIKHYNDPYGVFVKGVASCAGTARTAGFCLSLLGFEYEHRHENEYDHQWVEVMVNGEKWICDPYPCGYCGPKGDPHEPIVEYFEDGFTFIHYTYMDD